MASDFTIRNEIVEIGRRMHERGYVASNDGNISVRLQDASILITPAGISKGYMKPADMVRVSPEGKVLTDSVPSSELPLHLYVYQNRNEIQAICHAHPVYATAFAASGRELDACLLSEMVYTLGKVPLAAYGTPGSADVYKTLDGMIQSYDAFLLANHGVITMGTTLLESYHKMETVEHSAQIMFVAEQLGGGRKLSSSDVRELINLKTAKGIHTLTDCVSCDMDGTCKELPQQKISDKLIEEIVDKIIVRLK